jgi:transposase InsO family protein
MKTVLQAEREASIHLRRAGLSTAEIAAQLNRSERWVQKWWCRFQEGGWAALAGKSRVPHCHGTKLPEAIKQAVCQARSELEAEAAAKKRLKYKGSTAIRTRLKRKKVHPLPSKSSIERILREAEMTEPRQKTDPIIYPRLRPQQAHKLYQVDHAPHYLAGGEQVYNFNAIDTVSRYPTGKVFTRRRAQDACAFLLHVWQDMGIPHYTQVDNEACFSGGFTHQYVLGQCVRLALLVGTELLFSPVNHPKSNGTVERLHQAHQEYVWEDTYLSDVAAVEHQGERFFTLYRQREDHVALGGETPAQRHQRQPVQQVPANFSLPKGKLPIYAGRLHFMRRVKPDGSVSVLNVDWEVPDHDLKRGVWVTIELKPAGSHLLIYDEAPDAPERQLLACHPFPVKEPVLPRPSCMIPAEETEDIEIVSPATEERTTPLVIMPDTTESTDLLSLFGPTKPLGTAIVQPTKKFLRAALTRTAKAIDDVARTMY